MTIHRSFDFRFCGASQFWELDVESVKFVDVSVPPNRRAGAAILSLFPVIESDFGARREPACCLGELTRTWRQYLSCGSGIHAGTFLLPFGAPGDRQFSRAYMALKGWLPKTALSLEPLCHALKDSPLTLANL